MKTLSFIIPAYNSAHFLDKCIGSMLVEEVLTKLEIIVVNDGSTDNTAAVAEDYCSRYPGTVRLISQENKGHGGALNTGCAAATGKYLKVIDADDWICSENLPAFIEALEQCESDVVLTHFYTFDISNNEQKDWTCMPGEFGTQYTLQQVMANWRNFYKLFSFHGITYRTAFYREYGIRLSEHVFYEDFEFATFPCCHAESITPLDLFVYDYRIGDVNQSVSDASKLKRISHIETVLQRMSREHDRANLRKSGREYAAVKTQELLLSYFTVVLLANPDKRSGREMAANMMEQFRQSFPAVHGLAEKKYKVFCLLSRLHIGSATWKKLMESKLYRALRKG